MQDNFSSSSVPVDSHILYLGLDLGDDKTTVASVTEDYIEANHRINGVTADVNTQALKTIITEATTSAFSSAETNIHVANVIFKFSWYKADDTGVSDGGSNPLDNESASPASYFVVTDGVLTSLSDEGKAAVNGGETELVIPNSVTSIATDAFAYCDRLTSITIPSSVTSIGRNMLIGCTGLVTIRVDAENPKFDSRNDCNAIIRTSTNQLIAGCKTTIADSVTELGESIFYNCTSLTSIDIPYGVTRIGPYAFDMLPL